MTLLESLQTGQPPSLELITSKSIPLKTLYVSLQPHSLARFSKEFI